MDIEINAALAERALAGERLTAADLQTLDAADVLSLGMLADEVRRARVGDTVTFARVLEADATSPTSEEWARLVVEADEVRLTTLGPTREQTLARVRYVREQTPARVPVKGYSLAELARREWGPPADLLSALHHAGLDGLAEAPVDLVTPAELHDVFAAGLSLGALTLQAQPDGPRVAILERIREVVEAQPAATVVAPLAREQSVTAPTTGYHDVRMVALVRIGVPAARTIQVDWQQYGPKLAQVALTFGANHLDRVSLVDEPALGRRRTSLEEVRRNIVAAGFTPVEWTARR